MKKSAVFIALVLIITIACTQNKSNSDKEISNNLYKLEMVKVFEHSGNCGGEKEPCALTDIRYFKLKDTTTDCYKAFNLMLLKTALSCAGVMPDSVDENEMDAIAFARRYISEYNDFRKDFPEAPGEWEARSSMQILYENDTLICFQVDGYNYSGGAHPNSAYSLVSFNKKTCQELDMKQILNPSSEMLAIVEKEFRKNREIPQGQTLNEYGFSFDNDQFALPANVSFQKDSILFIYNDYEVGPHVMGPSFLKIPKRDLYPYLRIKY